MSDDQSPDQPGPDEEPGESPAPRRKSPRKAKQTGRKDYEVGYGKPPVEHQFKPGICPNEGGRGGKPDKPRKLIRPRAIGDDFRGELAKAIFIEEAYRLVTLKEDGKKITLPAIQAAYRSYFLSGIKGNRIAAKTAIEMAFEIESQDAREHVEYLLGTHKYIRDARQHIAKARQDGRPEPELLPHPDDILVDESLGAVVYAGPTNEAEKRKWDKRIQMRDDRQREAEICARQFRLKCNSHRKEFLLSEWHHAQLGFDIINDNLPPRYRVQLKYRSNAEGASRPGSQKRVAWPEN